MKNLKLRRLRRELEDLLARLRYGRPSTSFTDEEEFYGVLEDFAGDPLCIITKSHDVYLVDSTEDGDAFYVGIPYAEDEEGREVNKNTGWIRDLPEWAWPLTLVTPYSPQHRRWRRTRLLASARIARRDRKVKR